MNKSLIYIHEEALRITHPVFKSAPNHARTIYIWDDQYLKRANYSLKRLIFIYETLCELPIDIIRGETVETIQSLQPDKIYVPFTNHPDIRLQVEKISEIADVEIISDEVFCQVDGIEHARRFSQYWKKAEKDVFINRRDRHA